MKLAKILAGVRLTYLVIITGVFSLLLSLLLTFGNFFRIYLLSISVGETEVVSKNLGNFIIAAIIGGSGGITLWHGLRSLQGKASRPLWLPPIWVIAGVFGLFVITSSFVSENKFVTELLFPPFLALPPLFAVSWFIQQNSGRITWRRGLLAYAGGTIVGVLGFYFPLIIVLSLGMVMYAIASSVMIIASALTGTINDLEQWLLSPIPFTADLDFYIAYIACIAIVPLAGELIKSLVTLPIINRLSRRDAFLVGAMAGAGYAAFWNSFNTNLWTEIFTKALGGAIHPLGSGLVALGWHSVLRGESKAWTNWFARFGMAVGIHALWNGVASLVTEEKLRSELSQKIDILELPTVGTTLAILAILGLVALWLGRRTAKNAELSNISSSEPTKIDFTP